MKKNIIFKEIICRDWYDFSKIVNNRPMKYFAYRGHGSKNWNLHCSIKRAYDALKIPLKFHTKKEKEILNVFRSRAHLFLNHLPPHNQDLEWFSIMQHYGAPTRLLDFTYSPYIAMYFAFEDIAERKYQPCIYSLNVSELHQTNQHLFGNNYQEMFYKEKPMVFLFHPDYQHERLAHQQGLFAVFGSIENSLDELLETYENESLTVEKFIFTSSFIKQGIENLHLMNINKEILFPGIEGLCQSLKLQLSFPPLNLD